MKKLLLILMLLASFSLQAQFEKYFHDKSLRIDYYHTGDHESEIFSIDELLAEPNWGGSKINLVDTFRLGKYYFEVIDLASDSMIYSRGYSTLFGEWQNTAEAKETSKSFSESVLFPFPKNDVRVDFYSRNWEGEFEIKFTYEVDVDSYFIKPERRLEYPVYEAYISGDPAESVDILILPDGYTKREMALFQQDCNTFMDALFSFSPYDQNMDKFNIRGVLAPSEDSGVDIPADSVWKNTILSSSFYTFDSERYCMSLDNKSIRDLAANAPYDQIYILANDSKYGGGGIYNFYCLSVNSNSAAAKIFIHEFGHGFAGLGDEYYADEVAYSDFYNTEVEPWEPNLSTLVNFGSKWQELLSDTVPVPTPAEAPYLDILGVFEGGGYSAKGVYRPKYDCLMNTFKGNEFCGACKRAIQRMIDFYAE
ncbi:MAG: IgA Peptidase M64 [Bacteroidales bacterium]|nr:IgA Peptidase M64 [Bacteroidales bacterium]MCF8386620.1 IgA Peptidase M64 [Bacteroidales bacterium]MCF8397736.1 IgA Peptidase M64 [Bacteroidales bacterium]